jgi:2-dehydropantoate 2-reductase
VLQNGVEHAERLAAHCDAARVVPVVVDCAAQRLDPATIRQRRHARLVVAEGERARDLAALFAGTPVEVSTTGDLRSAAWNKLCFNVGGTVCALTGQPAGISRREDIGELIRGLCAECVAVGRAEGAVLEDDLPERIVEGHRRAPVDAVNSMLADRLAGRPMEVDARNGAVVRRGRAHGVATPLNAMALAVLEAASAPLSPR